MNRRIAFAGYLLGVLVVAAEAVAADQVAPSPVVMTESADGDSGMDMDTTTLEVRARGRGDIVAPELTISQPGTSVISKEPVQPIDLHFSDAGSGIDLATLKVSVDGTVVTASCSTQASSATCASPSLGSGSHTVQALIRDLAGNMANASRVFSFVLDQAPPTITATTAPPPNQRGWNNSGVTVRFECSDKTSGIASCPAPVVVDGEGGGQVVSGTARDLAGNTATTSVTLNIDKTPPVVSLAFPRDGLTLTTPELTATGTVADANEVTFLTCNRRPVVLNEGVFSCGLDFDSGPQTLNLVAVDIAGNIGTKSIGIEILLLPVVTITSPAPLATFRDRTVNVIGTVDSSDVVVKVNGVSAALTPNGAGIRFEASVVPLEEGKNVITAVATSSAGHSGASSIEVTVDNTPPRISIDSPRDGFVTDQPTVTVAGIINDVVVGTVNANNARVTVNGVVAQVANRSFRALDIPLKAGSNQITAVGIDSVGNTSEPATVVVERRGLAGERHIEPVSGNNQRGQISSELPDPLVVRLLDEAGKPAANENVVFRVVLGDGKVGSGAPGEAAAIAVRTDATGLAHTKLRLGAQAGQGNHRVRAKAVGFESEALFYASADPKPGDKVNVLSGNQQRGPIGQPLAKPLLVAVTDPGNNLVSNTEVRFEVTQGSGHFQNGSRVLTAVTDSNGRASAGLTLGFEEGFDFHRVSVTLAGSSGFAGFTATAFVPGDPAQTAISGVVLDNQDHPLPGVTLRVNGTGLRAVADAQGQFRISGAPVGTLHLIADGSATAAPGEWPTLSFELVTVAGVDNPLPRPIYLVKLNTEDAMVAGAEDMVFTLPKVPGFKLTVKAGSVTFPDGSKVGEITVTPVNADAVPMAPPNGMQPQFIVTIQPAGAIFDPPAPLTLPNVDGHPPGSQVEMYSFDHDLEQFVGIGFGTVSADGSVIESNPGVGVLKAGWHCGSQPGGTGCLHNCPQCRECKEPECECSITEPLEGFLCDDGNRCTARDTCRSGSCVPGMPEPDGTACGTAETDCKVLACVNGGCEVFGFIPDGSPCRDDTNPCTLDLCNAGKCNHYPKSDEAMCSRAEQECMFAQCFQGSCVSTVPLPQGSPCRGDGNDCTSDFCTSNGQCSHPFADNIACNLEPNAPECSIGMCSSGKCISARSSPEQVTECSVTITSPAPGSEYCPGDTITVKGSVIGTSDVVVSGVQATVQGSLWSARIMLPATPATLQTAIQADARVFGISAASASVNVTIPARPIKIISDQPCANSLPSICRDTATYYPSWYGWRWMKQVQVSTGNPADIRTLAWRELLQLRGSDPFKTGSFCNSPSRWQEFSNVPWDPSTGTFSDKYLISTSTPGTCGPGIDVGKLSLPATRTVSQTYQWRCDARDSPRRPDERYFAFGGTTITQTLFKDSESPSGYSVETRAGIGSVEQPYVGPAPP